MASTASQRGNESKQYWRYVGTNTLKGAIASLVLCAGTVFLANRKSASFRKLSMPLKSFVVTGTGVIGGIIAGDRASWRFGEYYTRQLEATEEGIEPVEKSLSMIDWVKENRWKAVCIAWIGSLAGSFYLINRQKTLTGAQKIVQARMYAQGLTLVLILSSAGLLITFPESNEGEERQIDDPNDPSKHITIKLSRRERYPGELRWEEQIAEEEAKMRASKKLK